MSRISKALKGKPKSEHMKQALKEYNKTDKAKAQKTKVLRNIAKSRINSGSGTVCTSKSELRIINYLRKYFIVEPQYLIEGYHHNYDMMVKLPSVNLIIEFDGDYWHSPKNPKWSKESDDKRKLVAENNGYGFLVIKESEYNVKGNLKFVKSEVAKFYPEFLNMHLIN